MTNPVQFISGYFSRMLTRACFSEEQLVKNIQEATTTPFRELQTAYANFRSQSSQPQFTAFSHATQALADRIVAITLQENNEYLPWQELEYTAQQINRVTSILLTDSIPAPILEKLSKAIENTIQDQRMQKDFEAEKKQLKKQYPALKSALKMEGAIQKESRAICEQLKNCKPSTQQKSSRARSVVSIADTPLHAVTRRIRLLQMTAAKYNIPRPSNETFIEAAPEHLRTELKSLLQEQGRA